MTQRASMRAAALKDRQELAPAHRGRIGVILVTLAIVLAYVALESLRHGIPDLTTERLGVVLRGGGNSLENVVVLQLRLPRLVLAMLAGACLAVAGALLQDTLRNPLAGPELLGVSSGAGLVVTATVVFHLQLPAAVLPALGLAGGLAAGGFVIGLTLRNNDPVRVVLLGAAVSALLSAVVVAIVTLANQGEAIQLFAYLLGGLANRTWDQVILVLPWAAVGLILAVLARRTVNLLMLDDDIAQSLGLRVARTRLAMLVLAAGLVGAVAAACGPIPYIALLAPHAARRLLGTVDARAVIPLAAALGACLLPAADLVARLLFFPAELPVGIWLTVLGVPLFLLIFQRQLGAGRR